MADFKKQGGSLTGREERYDGFEGEPKAVGGALAGGHHHHGGHHSGTGVDSTTGTGIGSTTGTTGSGIGSTRGTGTGYDETLGSTTGTKPSMMDKLNPKTDADGDGKRGIGN